MHAKAGGVNGIDDRVGHLRLGQVRTEGNADRGRIVDHRGFVGIELKLANLPSTVGDRKEAAVPEGGPAAGDDQRGTQIGVVREVRGGVKTRTQTAELDRRVVDGSIAHQGRAVAAIDRGDNQAIGHGMLVHRVHDFLSRRFVSRPRVQVEEDRIRHDVDSQGGSRGAIPQIIARDENVDFLLVGTYRRKLHHRFVVRIEVRRGGDMWRQTLGRERGRFGGADPQTECSRPNHVAGDRVDQTVQILGECQHGSIGGRVIIHMDRFDDHVIRVADGVRREDQLIEIGILRRPRGRSPQIVVLDEQVIVVEVNLDLIPGLHDRAVGGARHRLRHHRDHLRSQIQREINRVLGGIAVAIVQRWHKALVAQVPQRIG